MPNPVHRRPTLQDIARLIGVHHSTVSLALRNHPRISEATRRRVREAAERLRYRPDPVLASFMAYRRGLRAAPGASVIAWLTNYPSRRGWRRTPVFAELHAGAAARAEALGFRLEEFWLRDEGMSPARASQILVARNITAVLVAPQPTPDACLELDWSRFSAVTFGYTLVEPRLHLVSNHQFASMIRLIEELLALGYRRPALAIPRQLDRRVRHGWLGGFLAEQAQLPVRCRTRALVFDRFERDRFARWLDHEQPDVIVSPTEEVWRELGRRGIRIPDELGFALPSRPLPNETRAGIDENSAAIGAAGVDLLQGIWQRHERGVPRVPQRLMIEGTWVAGTTVRRVGPASVAGTSVGKSQM